MYAHLYFQRNAIVFKKKKEDFSIHMLFTTELSQISHNFDIGGDKSQSIHNTDVCNAVFMYLKYISML